MNSSTLRILGIVVALLLIALFVVERGDDGGPAESGELLFPDLKAQLNDVTGIRIERFGEDPVIINRDDGAWRVAARDGFPADVVKIRELLLAVADAETMEAKTANPEMHGRLGLRAPDAENSKGTLVTTTVGGTDYALIFGNVAQTSNRYARRAGEDQTWLVNQNPDIPGSAGDWLVSDLVDIASTQVRSVTITHPDGETIHVEKAAEEDTNFTVNDVPEGRELSYSTVGNGIAGALNDLDLDDVRLAVDAGEAVTTVFETFDDMTVTVRTVRGEEESWLSLEAAGGPETEAESLNALASGWQFRVADYKANLFTRRWEDILEAEESDEPEVPE